MMTLDALAPEFRPEADQGLTPTDVYELEEVDLCNETLANLDMLEHEDSIVRGLYELMAQDYLAATGELAEPPRLTTLSLADGMEYDSPPRSPRSNFHPGVPLDDSGFAKRDAKRKQIMHKEFGRRRC